MATPSSTRAALAEIPRRFEQLRFGRTPTTNLANDPIVPDDVNPPLLRNSNDNIPLTYLSPVISPDELIIRQRGRRVTLSWSPDKYSTQTSTQKTPTKSSSSTMVLRSSPRKRLLLSEGSSTSSLSRNATESQIKTLFPSAPKRKKVEEKPLASIDQDTPLPIMLRGLSHNQLVEIIKNLVKNTPELEQKIRSECPIPDLSPMEEQLSHIKRNIYKSLPTSQLCKKTDSIAYARAATHVVAFKKSVVKQSRILYESRHWDALLDYVQMAWSYVRATPIWDNIPHNAARKQCFKTLSVHCSAALRYGGSKLGHQRLLNLERAIPGMARDYEDILTCADKLNQILLQYNIA